MRLIYNKATKSFSYDRIPTVKISEESKRFSAAFNRLLVGELKELKRSKGKFRSPNKLSESEATKFFHGLEALLSGFGLNPQYCIAWLQKYSINQRGDLYIYLDVISDKYPRIESLFLNESINDWINDNTVSSYLSEMVDGWISMVSPKSKNYSIPEANKGGDCYVKAWNYFQNNAHKNKDLRLVHGLVTGQGPIKGIIYNHAWCEDISKGIVYDMTFPKMYQQLPSSLYYKLGKIKDNYKYDQGEVLERALEYGTYGPWEHKLLKNKY